MERVIPKEESQAYDRGVYATLLGAFLVLFQIGIYFVYIPWNAERLQITEAEIEMGTMHHQRPSKARIAEEHNP